MEFSPSKTPVCQFWVQNDQSLRPNPLHRVQVWLHVISTAAANEMHFICRCTIFDKKICVPDTSAWVHHGTLLELCFNCRPI